MSRSNDHHEAMEQLLKRSGEFSSSSSSDEDDVRLFDLRDDKHPKGDKDDDDVRDPKGQTETRRRAQGRDKDHDDDQDDDDQDDDDFYTLTQIQLEGVNDTVRLYKDSQLLLDEANSETLALELELPPVLSKSNSHTGNGDNINSNNNALYRGEGLGEAELAFSESDELEDAQQVFRSKYPHVHIPYSDELIELTGPYRDTVLSILDGTLGSQYYSRAKRVAQGSAKPFISVEEFRSLDLSQFTAGYFGLRRQLKLGGLIYEKYREVLSRSRSPKIQWWGPVDFSNYVLAPEVLVSMVLETCKGKRSLKLSCREDVYRLFDDTASYGLDVTDKEPLESWEVKATRKKHNEHKRKKIKRVR
ncbi:Restriction of telomere capping protein 4 [Nakaseomyces bracarensis]|uniref:Restriction of telomere capping protein 4 n=1 Tax=Nakaseomyces bracarensis TaxID=273131 RepID=A0ABR4NYJ2_9SACH